ncbi:cell death abnormality protein 1-like [Haliotis rubra]|uniref:cell death abnormality protein 1-like n=1 Tax=Haliotis rubra TaxID=36100 RepID=UPI001EE4ECD3|nr:cell death abnormality protein 1-like [Haliotis rubra]
MTLSQVYTCLVFAMLAAPNDARCVPLLPRMACNLELNTCANNRCAHFAIICPVGSYGLRCKAKCSNHCVEGKCHLTERGAEICTKGCVKGWRGISCLEGCPYPCSECDRDTGACTDQCGDGLYGDGCTKECPKSCVRCDKVTGECSASQHSLALFKGSGTACPNGYYGVDCSKRCTLGCENCDQRTGDCLLDETQTEPSTALKNITDDTSSVDKLPEVRSSDVNMLMVIGLGVMSASLLLIVVFQCLWFRMRRNRQITDKEDLKDAHLSLNEPKYTHVYDEIPEDADDSRFPKQREYLTATFTNDGLDPSLTHKIAASGYLHPLGIRGPYVAPHLSYPNCAPFEA